MNPNSILLYDGGGCAIAFGTVAGRASPRANLRCLGHSATINYREGGAL